MPKIRFRARIERIDAGMGSWAQIVLPRSASARHGSRARVSIQGTVNGFRSSGFPAGAGTRQFMVNRAMREGTGTEIGDRVDVAIDVDTAPPGGRPRRAEVGAGRLEAGPDRVEKMPPRTGARSPASWPRPRSRRRARAGRV